jgi:hypothetical protein
MPLGSSKLLGAFEVVDRFDQVARLVLRLPADVEQQLSLSLRQAVPDVEMITTLVGP